MLTCTHVGTLAQVCKMSKRKGRRRSGGEGAMECVENAESEGDWRKNASKKSRLSMSSLATSDPEFYQYLRDNDHQLLEFEEDESGEEERDWNSERGDSGEGGDSEEGGGSGEGGDSEEGREVESVPAHISSWRHREHSGADESSDSGESGEDVESGVERGGVPVTVAMVKNWVDTITKDHSLSVVKQLSLALQAAVCGVREEEEVEEETNTYTVTGTSEFNAVVLACLSHVAPCLHHHITSSHHSSKKPFLPSSHKKWNRVRPVIQPYCQVVLKLLAGLREPSMVCAILRHIRSLVSYYVSVSKLQRSLSRALLKLWEGQDNQVQVLSFLVLRELTLLTPHPSLHTTLKKLYLTFVRNAKFTSLASLTRISFMKNCVVEVISLDVATGYQHGFVYIRQLALHLRAAITSGKKETLQVVRCWQFVHCIDLWSQALSSLLPSPALRPLLYPLVEVAMGTLALQPSPRTVPLRLHLVASLSRLVSTTGTYIPLAPFLLEVLESHGDRLLPGAQSAKPPELSCLLRASASQLHSRGYQTTILTRGFELLLRLLASQTHLIGFPELAYTSLVRLRKLMKTTQISWFRQQLKQLIEKVEEVSGDITRARSHVTFAPKDTDEIVAWEGLRRERGGDVLNRFLATWEKLHSGPETTPTTPRTKEKQAAKKELPQGRGGKREREGEGERKGEREGEEAVSDGESNEDDIVEDFVFSSDSDLSD